MYYLIASEWTGPRPNPFDPSKAGVVYTLQDTPGRTNQSREERVEGWLGTTNDWYEYAHGAYETVEEARDAAARLAGGVVYDAASEDCEHDAAEGIVARWYDADRRAEYWEAAEWLYDVRHELRARLLAGETVDDLAAELEADAATQVEIERPAGVHLLGTEKFLRRLIEAEVHLDMAGVGTVHVVRL